VNDYWSLDDDDLEILRQAVFALHRQYQAQAIVDEEGMTYKIGDTIRQHPGIQLELKAREQFLRAVKQLELVDEDSKRRPGRPGEGYYYE
jgi:hypothetical protein